MSIAIFKWRNEQKLFYISIRFDISIFGNLDIFRSNLDIFSFILLKFDDDRRKSYDYTKPYSDLWAESGINEIYFI